MADILANLFFAITLFFEIIALTCMVLTVLVHLDVVDLRWLLDDDKPEG